MLKSVDKDAKELSLSIAKGISNEDATPYVNQELENLMIQKSDLEDEIEKIEEKLQKVEVDVISLDQFLNLSKNAPNTIRNGDAVLKDAICRFIFLNIDIGVDEVLSYKLKEPFDTLIKQRKKSNGRGGRT
ncbi:hypothetical protein JXA34_02725 [Patescibacteria group bacterium]|nr:hypothetical protein [Patescibacteria group bacterium]